MHLLWYFTTKLTRGLLRLEIMQAPFGIFLNLFYKAVARARTQDTFIGSFIGWNLFIDTAIKMRQKPHVPAMQLA